MTKTKEFTIKKDMRSFTNRHKTKDSHYVSRWRVGDNEYRAVLFPNPDKEFKIVSYGGAVYDNFEDSGESVGRAKMTIGDNGICTTNVEIGEGKYRITSYPEFKDGVLSHLSGPVKIAEYDEESGEITTK